MGLEPATTALVTTHWQNDIAGPDGAFAPFFRAQVEKHGVTDVARRLLDGAHSVGAHVVYTRIAFKPGHSDLVTNVQLLGVVAEQGRLLDGTPAADVIDELKPAPEDWNVVNPKVSGFVESVLDTRLRSAGVDIIVLFRVATNFSVESTGRSAGDLGCPVGRRRLYRGHRRGPLRFPGDLRAPRRNGLRSRRPRGPLTTHPPHHRLHTTGPVQDMLAAREVGPLR